MGGGGCGGTLPLGNFEMLVLFGGMLPREKIEILALFGGLVHLFGILVSRYNCLFQSISEHSLIQQEKNPSFFTDSCKN